MSVSRDGKYVNIFRRSSCSGKIDVSSSLVRLKHEAVVEGEPSFPLERKEQIEPSKGGAVCDHILTLTERLMRRGVGIGRWNAENFSTPGVLLILKESVLVRSRWTDVNSATRRPDCRVKGRGIRDRDLLRPKVTSTSTSTSRSRAFDRLRKSSAAGICI